MTRTLAEVIESVRQLAEAVTVECSCCHGAGYFVSTVGSQGGPEPGTASCGACGGHGKNPDPAYAPLLALLEEESREWVSAVVAPKGALRGSLEDALDVVGVKLWGISAHPITDLAAVKAVEAWLKREAVEAWLKGGAQ